MHVLLSFKFQSNKSKEGVEFWKFFGLLILHSFKKNSFVSLLVQNSSGQIEAAPFKVFASKGTEEVTTFEFRVEK